jgi:hypothetical protein
MKKIISNLGAGQLRRRLSQPSRAGVYINNGVVKVNK